MFLFSNKTVLPSPERPCAVARSHCRAARFHFVNGNPLKPPFPTGTEMALFGLGCFWGAERKFWQIEEVYVTAVGYAGGFTPNPTYEESLQRHEPAMPRSYSWYSIPRWSVVGTY